MSTHTVSPKQGIDFTMMYATHNALRRDLELLWTAVESGRTSEPSVREGWRIFAAQLRVHHVAEDVALWPPVRAKVADRPSDLRLLDDMQQEHDKLDPVLDAVDSVLAGTAGTAGAAAPSGPRMRELADELSTLLNGHLEHEEIAALPLIRDQLVPKEWEGFVAEARRRVGVRGAAVYIPWLLDGASTSAAAEVLKVLPPPVRLLYRFVWRPRYARRRLW